MIIKNKLQTKKPLRNFHNNNYYWFKKQRIHCHKINSQKNITQTKRANSCFVNSLFLRFLI